MACSRALRGRILWGLLLIIAVFCLLGAIYSVTIPLFEAPDEIWHFSFIQVLATRRALPVQPTEGKDMWLREAGQPPLYHLVAALLVAPIDTSDFPGFVRFNIAHPAIDERSESESRNVFIHTPHEAFPYKGAVLAVHLVRLFSVLWGAGTIVGVYLVAREIVPTRPGLALAAAAVAALNPHFIFISSVVNNDATAIFLCTLVLWLSIRVARAADSRKGNIVLGVLLGLALLSKLSSLALLALVMLALALAWWRERDLGTLLIRGCAVFVPAVLVSGWWYLRNWLLYGDPLGWSVWLIDIGVHHISLAELLKQFGHVATSFWSPADDLLPAPVLWGLGLLLVIAAVGWGKMIVQIGRRGHPRAGGLLLTGTWPILLFASLVRYMTITPSAEGRFLLPAIAPISLLLVLGWDAMVDRRWKRGTAIAVGTALLALCIAIPFFAIPPLYAWPLIDEIDDLQGMTPLKDVSLDGVRLLGIEATPQEARTGDRVYVTLYWEVLDTPPADLRAVVRLWTAGGHLAGQRDGTPAGEDYPPDLWRAGDIVRDVYRFELRGPGPALYRVSVSVLNGDESLGDVSSTNVFKLAPPPLSKEGTHPLAYNLDNKVALIGYHVSDNPSSPGEALTVTLYWRALAEMSEAYTVFVHLLDADGTLLAQGDGPPLEGDYPTYSWSPGEELADTHAIPIQAGQVTGTHLLVGLYRLEDGTRLPVYASTDTRLPADAIPLDLSAPVSGSSEP